MCLAVIGAYVNGAPAKCFSLKVSRTRALANAGECVDHAFPGIQVARRFAPAADVLSSVKLGLNRCDDVLGNVILYLENIGKITVVTRGPDMVSQLRIDQLHGDTQPCAAATHTAFQYITHAQFAADRLHVDHATPCR